ncbi:hypothetical protein ACQ4PT_009866 [Festuca glaucescens]
MPSAADRSVTPVGGERRRSPSRGRSRARRGGGEIVVQREVVRESGGGSGTNLSFPMLTRGGYTNWAMVMEVNLQAASLWDAIEDDTVPRREDKQALAALLRSTPPEMHCMLIGKGTAKAAWEAIRLQYQGGDRVRDSRLRRLRTEFETVTFKPNERIDEAAMQISNIAAALRSLGDIVDDEKVVRKFLSVVPTRFVQIAFSIETLLNPATLPVEEVVGHLRAVEEWLDADQGGDASGQLLLTEQQWEARKKQARGGASSSRTDGRGGNPSADGKKGAQPQQGGPQNGTVVDKEKCRYCGKKGHWARECRKKQRDEAAKAAAAPAAANLVQAEEDDDGPVMMMACVQEVVEGDARPLVTVQPSTPTSGDSGACTGGHVFLNEERAVITPSSDENHGSEVWFLDTGATNHMTGSEEAFAVLDRSVSGKVRFADGSVVDIRGRDTVVFAVDGGDHRAFTEVFFIPALKSSVVSLGQLDEGWFDINIRRGILTVRDHCQRILFKVKRSPNRLYKLTFTPVHPVCLSTGYVSEAWRWHARLGHLHFDGMQRMSWGGLVRGLPHIDHADELCEACLAGKQRRQPFPQKARFRAQRPLELVHGDLCGPITPPMPGGHRYILVMINDRSRYMWVELLGSKDKAAQAIIKVQAAAEVECGHKLHVLRTDRGGEFTSATFYQHCAKAGVQRHLTAPNTPQQNGVVERRNQTLLRMARSMMKAKQVPSMFWGEAVLTAAFILNRSFTRSVDGMTPYEAWHGVKPEVRFLRVFGCVGHVKVSGTHLKKLDDRSTPMVFVGYATGSKAYKMYNPATKRVTVSRDVVFDEEARWNWEAPGETPASSSFTVEYPAYVMHTATAAKSVAAEKGAQSPAAAGPCRNSAPPATPALVTPSAATTPVRAAEGGGTSVEPTVRFATPPTVRSELFDADDHASAPHRFRRVDDLLGNPVALPMQAERPGLFDDEELLLVAGEEEPASFAEAEREECWRRAMLDELQSIDDNNTWTLTPLPAGHRAIGLKWVYKIKKDEQGHVVKHKARLVAKGYVQCAGVDFEEVYAPVARLESVRLILALAAHRGWEVHHMDVKSPERALLLVGVYVDDLIIAGADTQELHRFKDEMKRHFSMSDLGLLRYYLGLEVKQENGRTTISQAGYASKLLDKAGMAGCNATHTPMEPRCRLSKESKEAAVDATFYRSVIGSLRYLVHTRPDIPFAVGFLSRFMEAPAGDHLAAVKHLLRYISGTLSHGCVYRRGGCETLISFSDSDHAGDVDTRKSTSGVLIYLGDSLVSWQSQKQKVVATSSCEAEYIAAATAACQGIWLAQLVGELLNQEAAPITIYIDNKSAISLCKNPVLHDRSKHIDLRYHFIRNCVEKGTVAVEFIGIVEQKADMLTKPLSRVRFQELRGKVGIIDVKVGRQG